MKTPMLAAAIAALPLAVAAQEVADQRPRPAQTGRDCGALPGTFEGHAFSGDGDTIYGVGYGPPIRLWGVQAPELRDSGKGETVPGMRTRAALEDLFAVADWKVRCEPRKFDRYCRVVASCTAGDKDVSLELLRAGLAYGFWLSDAAGPGTSVTYARAEAEARRERRGLWKMWLGEK